MGGLGAAFVVMLIVAVIYGLATLARDSEMRRDERKKLKWQDEYRREQEEKRK